MRANISDELLNEIVERIYLDLEINVLTRRLHKAELEGKEGFAKHIDKLISDTIKKRKVSNDILKQNGIKIFEPVEIDDMFVSYKYYQKIMGGYKEGEQRFWKKAILLQLKKRMSGYFELKR